MKFANSQKGISILSWLAILVLAGFLVTVGMKMVPHYVDNKAILGFIDKVGSDQAAEVKSVGEFIAYLESAMTINGIRDVDLKKALKIKMVNNEFLGRLKYEQRETLAGNLDLVARFDKEFHVRMP